MKPEDFEKLPGDGGALDAVENFDFWFRCGGNQRTEISGGVNSWDTSAVVEAYSGVNVSLNGAAVEFVKKNTNLSSLCLSEP